MYMGLEEAKWQKRLGNGVVKTAGGNPKPHLLVSQMV
jgi:hypothetical protein